LGGGLRWLARRRPELGKVPPLAQTAEVGQGEQRAALAAASCA